jgi:Predicted metal-dependent hydrolase with the TIM-barrel fold
MSSAKAEEPDVIDDLRKAKEHGLAAIVDLSAPGWGRDPIALRRISEQAGRRGVRERILLGSVSRHRHQGLGGRSCATR